MHRYKHRHTKDSDGTHISDPPFRSHSQARSKAHIAYVSNSCPACLFMPMGWKEPPGRERFCGPSPNTRILKPKTMGLLTPVDSQPRFYVQSSLELPSLQPGPAQPLVHLSCPSPEQGSLGQSRAGKQVTASRERSFSNEKRLCAGPEAPGE